MPRTTFVPFSYPIIDLTPLFNWNTKQLFIYFEAEYDSTSGVSPTSHLFGKLYPGTCFFGNRSHAALRASVSILTAAGVSSFGGLF